MKIKPEFKAKWLAALRSGKYQQTFGDLQEVKPEGTCHCVMGVLAQEIDPTYYKWDPCRSVLDKDFMSLVLLDSPVRNWSMCNLRIPREAAGLTGESSWICVPSTTTVSLVELNDEHELSFHQLADLIEEYL